MPFVFPLLCLFPDKPGNTEEEKTKPREKGKSRKRYGPNSPLLWVLEQKMVVAAESADKREQEAIVSFPHCGGSTVVEPESRRKMNSGRATVKSPLCLKALPKIWAVPKGIRR